MARIGHGKTQAIEWIVSQLLKRPDPPSIIMVDSQGEMLHRIARLKVFAPGGRLEKRLVLIDPREIEKPVALNPFALRQDRLKNYSPAMVEQITNGTIELMEYLFGAVLGAELTQKMSVVFRYLARLLLAIPGANIVTLRDVLQAPERYAKEMEKLDGSAREFFKQQFFAKDFTATRQQILRRLWGIFEQPTFERMMGTRENKVDLFELMQSGCVVLADTAKDFLASERSAILGRLVIALTLRAVFERAAVSGALRRPAFLIIDECQEVIDEKVSELLSQSRKYKAGTIVAHQILDQLPKGLRGSLASNTGVKMIGAVSDADARDLAADMGTSAAFLTASQRQAMSSEFALYVRNKTRAAVRLVVPFGSLDREPRMSDHEWELVKQRNRDRYGEPRSTRVTAAAVVSPPAATMTIGEADGLVHRRQDHQRSSLSLPATDLA